MRATPVIFSSTKVMMTGLSEKRIAFIHWRGSSPGR